MDVAKLAAGFPGIPGSIVATESGTSSVQLLMLAGAIAALALLMISTYRRSRVARGGQRRNVRERYAELQRDSQDKRDAEQVILELDQVARQIHGRLDTKLAMLETVIRDADQRIDHLSQLVRTARGDLSIDVTMGGEDPNASPPGDADGDPHAGIHHLAEGGLTPVEIARETGRSIGEIELILALRKTKERVSG